MAHPFFPWRALVLVAFLAAPGALAQSKEGPVPASVTFQNLSLATTLDPGGVRSSDVLVAFAVKESDQGGQDLDGDGDALDSVLYVHDAVRGITTGLVALSSGAAPRFVVSGHTVAIAAQESTDLNGDGDPLDIVPVGFDCRTGVLVNTGAGIEPDHLGVVFPVVDAAGEVLTFWASEADTGSRDLNGDGDGKDLVAGFHDFGTGTTTFLPGTSARAPLATPHAVIFSTRELLDGNDLNGDGSLDDTVLQAYELATGTTRSLGVDDRVESVVTAGSRLAVAVFEASVGLGLFGQDLNGDSDKDDEVLHVLGLPSGSTRSLAIAVRGQGLISVSDSLATSREGLAVRVPEVAQGNTDLNADGDFSDFVLHALDFEGKRLTNLGVAVSRYAIVDSLVVATVEESEQGLQDLNGNGTFTDSVLFLHDLATGQSRNLGLAIHASADPVVVGNDRLLAFDVDEVTQGQDLDGDGDLNECVVHVYDRATGTVTNLGLAQDTPNDVREHGLLVLGDTVWFGVREFKQGKTDLNGDGDTGDFVLHSCDLSTGTVVNWSRAIAGAPHAVGNELAVFISESDEQSDWNGDGDTLDDVVHLSSGASGL